jgi:flagellar biosynthesis anti-sigma factor FlgM
MRIGLNTTDPQLVATEQAKKSSTDAAGQPQPSTVGDKVSVSQDNVTLSSLASQALGQPEVRQSLVDSLRQSINSGNYQIDPNEIAGAILGD